MSRHAEETAAAVLLVRPSLTVALSFVMKTRLCVVEMTLQGGCLLVIFAFNLEAHGNPKHLLVRRTAIMQIFPAIPAFARPIVLRIPAEPVSVRRIA